jgi:hypothetical protein
MHVSSASTPTNRTTGVALTTSAELALGRRMISAIAPNQVIRRRGRDVALTVVGTEEVANDAVILHGPGKAIRRYRGSANQGRDEERCLSRVLLDRVNALDLIHRDFNRLSEAVPDADDGIAPHCGLGDWYLTVIIVDDHNGSGTLGRKELSGIANRLH